MYIKKNAGRTVPSILKYTSHVFLALAILRLFGGSMIGSGDFIRNFLPSSSMKILPLPIRSPGATQIAHHSDTRCIRCGSSSLWQSVGGVSDIGLWHQAITPQELQNISLLDSSFFMLNCPQEWHRGNLLAWGFVLLGGLDLLLLGTAHPFLGRLTFGTFRHVGPHSRGCLLGDKGVAYQGSCAVSLSVPGSQAYRVQSVF